MIRTVKGKKTPINGGKKPSGPISFYDVVAKKKVTVQPSGFALKVMKNGRHFLVAKNAGTRKDGSKFDLHRVIASS